jgi:SAM-dependent methyltransferase
MASYYDDLCVTAYDFDAPVLAREYDAAYSTSRSWMRDLALALQDVARDRNVLEVAAGHGRWTRYLARTARQVLVTDASARMLVQARELIATANDVPPDRCQFLRIDAFHLDQLPRHFNVGVAVNFFQHIPYARHDDFLRAFHQALGHGATALIAINRLRRETRARFYRRPGERDTCDARPRPDGSVCEIIDNVFSEGQLRAIFDPWASGLRYRLGAKFYWITYRVK